MTTAGQQEEAKATGIWGQIIGASSAVKALVGAVTALFGLAAVVVASLKPSTGVTAEVEKTSISSAPTAASRPPVGIKTRQLLWGPSDCGTATPRIGLDGCTDFRELAWLEGQVERLRVLGVLGFRDLPRGVRLEPRPLRDKANWVLYARIGSEARWTIGVGYDASTNAKDGALRVYRSGERHPLSPAAYLEDSGSWVVDGKLVTESPK
jgi:hypothetical protein